MKQKTQSEWAQKRSFPFVFVFVIAAVAAAAAVALIMEFTKNFCCFLFNAIRIDMKQSEE